MVATLEEFISPWLAAASCLTFAIIFVGSLFVFPLDDPARKRAKLLERLEREELEQLEQQQQQQQPQQQQQQQQKPQTPQQQQASPQLQQLQLQPTSPPLSLPPPQQEQQQQQQKRHSQDRRSEEQYSLPGVNGYIPVATSSAPSGTSTSKSSSNSSSSSSSSSSSAPKMVLSGAGHRLSAHSPRIVSSSSQLEAQFDRHSPNQNHIYHSNHHNHQHPHQRHHTAYPYQNSSTIPIPQQPRLDRDHPLVIKRRFKGILLTSIVVPFYLWFVFSISGAIPTDQSFGQRLGRFLSFLGLALPGSIFKLINHLVLPLLLVMILFAGPLLMMFLSKELPFQQAFDWRSQRKYLLGWIALRNYVVGPLAEEFIFRACMVAVTSISGATKSAMVFGLPMVFGVAHIHHAYESYTKNNRTRQALLNALAISLFQLFYTTLFGWFATYAFLRTSNVLGPTLAHAFCNLMGFPDVTNIQYFGRWKYALYATFAVGVLAFALLLNPLTHPALYGDAGVSPYWTVTMGSAAASLGPSTDGGGVGGGGAEAVVKDKGLKKVVQSVKEAVKTAMTQHQQRP
ncbi:hypothetical protein DFQ26_006603 [Actinomortierella ambigua]|nr:hypothetical protein DFQ26_006603 [Actinomortierella ambigua]